ncbi:MAG: energy transducer TonB [Blastocatellia bacterium]|nr:energy transducer TonB [Blastocatellia bacterium]
MKSIYGVGVDFVVWTITLMILASLPALAQGNGQDKQDQDKQDKAAAEARPVWITLKSGDVYTGIFVKMDNNSIEFKVNDVVQSKRMSDVSDIRFGNSPFALPAPNSPDSKPADAAAAPADVSNEPSGTFNRKLTIISQEKAKYTDEARRNEVQGTVVLNVMFSYDGTISSIQVVRGLPDGLTDSAIEAAQKIKFIPAMKNGEPVSIRGDVEFSFNLDVPLPAPALTSPKDNEFITTGQRRVVLQWEPVPCARRYKVRIEKEGKRAGKWTLDHTTEVTATTYEPDFAGADAWRWRVEAINAAERDGKWSEWRILRFIKMAE